MEHPYIFTGIFVSRRELLERAAAYGAAVRSLAAPVLHPHVTLAFKPRSVDASLFGTQAAVTVIGYGNDGINEGFLVRVEVCEPAIAAMAEAVPVPHITISIAQNGRAVDTARLRFEPIQPFRLHGVFGAWHKDGAVITQPEQRQNSDA